MKKVIRIGTRESELAMWQAYTVKNLLEDLGYETEIIPIKSLGDIELSQPLYKMGVTGIFTKTLDVALLNGDIDIAVHSMKDVPTSLPKGITQTAVLERGDVHDILFYKDDLNFLFRENAVIATGSLRRKAQWLYRYPKHHIENLRGNVNTRMQKLAESNWNAAIFAAAGLQRINKVPEKHIVLDWMLPAPAQGAIVVMARENNKFAMKTTSLLNDITTYICTLVERDFLRTLEGGCTAPIGALAQIQDNQLLFEGALFSLNGKKRIKIEKKINIGEYHRAGKRFALEVLKKGGKEIIQEISKIIEISDNK